MNHNIQTYRPHPRLAPFIETYYVFQTGRLSGESVVEKAFPDGSATIIFSLDSEVYVPNRDFLMMPANPLLVGTMTHCHDDEFSAGVTLFGINFQPGGFSSFFDFPLHEVVNEVIEFNDFLCPASEAPGSQLAAMVDKFLLGRLSIPDPVLSLHPILKDIYEAHGNIEIGHLAKKHFLHERKLQRLFRRYVGIDPKTFTKIVRFDYTLHVIKQRDPQTSLLDIAFACGYYDHAHLTREIKKYSGLTPSQL